MPRDSLTLSWVGLRPGPIASTVTERPRSPGTSWPEWSPPLVMAPRGSRSDSGCSASRTGIATAPWPSTRPSKHATSRRCRATSTSRWAGAYVIGTGRAADHQKALDFGANEFVDLDNEVLEDVGGVDLVFDLIGGDIGKRSARLVRAGGTLVSIVGPVEARPAEGLAVDFVVESDRAQLSEIVQRVRDGRLRTNIGTVSALDDAVAAFNSTERRPGKTIIRVHL